MEFDDRSLAMATSFIIIKNYVLLISYCTLLTCFYGARVTFGCFPAFTLLNGARGKVSCAPNAVIQVEGVFSRPSVTWLRWRPVPGIEPRC